MYANKLDNLDEVDKFYFDVCTFHLDEVKSTNIKTGCRGNRKCE